MAEEDDVPSTGSEVDEYDSYSSEDIEKEKQYVEVGRESYSKISIDYYKTKMHGAQIGIRQKAQYMSKSRQFTKNTEVRGEITFYYGWDKESKEMDDFKEVVTLNEFWWNVDPKSKLYQKAGELYKEYDAGEYAKLMRRVEVKTFIGLDKKHGENQGLWTGGIEESQIMSLALTFGEKDPLPFFWIILPGYKYRIPIFRTHAVTGERFSFILFNENGENLVPYYIEGKRLTPGSDYTVFNAATMQKVAAIDDRSMNVGGKIDITFFQDFDALNRDRVFRRILVLFACLSKYLHESYETYRTLHRALTAQKDYREDMAKAQKKADPTAETAKVNEKYQKAMMKMKFIKQYNVGSQELTLHYNPRRIRS